MTDLATRTTDWQIRSAGPADLRGFMSPIPLAFGEDLPEADLADWAQVLEPERFIGAFERGADGADGAREAEAPRPVLGCAAALSLRLTVPGGALPAAAVTAVAVRPDQRRRGILTSLMRHQLDDARDRGEPVAILWASEGAIYQRFGYGMAAMDGAIEVDTHRTRYLRTEAPEGRVRLLDESAAAEAFPPVYEAMRHVTPGAVSRSEAWWRFGPLSDPERRRRSLSPKYRAVYEADGSAEGYAIYRIREDWDQRGPRHTVEVSEAVTTTPRALRELWRFLFETDLARAVKASRMAFPSPLQLLLAEPRALGLVVHDGLWLRLVDLPAALGGRTFGSADSLVLEVTDDFCPWNAGRWRVDARDGSGAGARVERTDGPADLVLETSDLAAMYLGGLQASQLALAGRVLEETPRALRRADALFASDRTPWCVSMF